MVGLAVVSHSARLAAGVAELMEQMGQGRVPIAAVGGTADGRLGTDVEAVRDAIRSVMGPDGVVVLVDLGSSVMGALAALELLEPGESARVEISAGPLVEGAVVAVVEASMGRPRQEVRAAADSAMLEPKF